MKIGFTHKPAPNGGPGTFQTHLQNALDEKNYTIVYPDDNIHPDVIVVIAGTRKLNWLYQCKRKGSKIIHRLDGINWMHRRPPYNVRHFFYGEITNFISKFIRRRLADLVIYQSKFVEYWWKNSVSNFTHKSTIIYNGALLRKKSISKNNDRDVIKLICVEGNIPETVFSEWMINAIANARLEGIKINLTIVGRASEMFMDKFKNLRNIKFVGRVPREKVGSYLEQSDIFISLEILGACPNSVLEALSYSLPVIGFDSGAVGELVGNAGVLLPLDNKDAMAGHSSFTNHQFQIAMETILSNYDEYAHKAFSRVENKLNTQVMTAEYIKLIENIIDKRK